MKTFLKFVKSNFIGVMTGIALAILVWIFTDFNIWLLLLGFVGGYFVVGIIVEFITLYFADGITRTPKNAKVRPDKRAAVELASSDEIDFMTEDDLYEPDDGRDQYDQDDEDAPQESGDGSTDAGEDRKAEG